MQVRRNMLLPSGVSCRHKDAREDKLLNSWTDSLNQQTDCWCRIYHINIIYNKNFVHSKHTGGWWWGGGGGSAWEGGRCPEVELPGWRHQRGCWSGSTGRQQKCRANEQNQCAAEAANKQRSPGTLSHFRQIQIPAQLQTKVTKQNWVCTFRNPTAVRSAATPSVRYFLLPVFLLINDGIWISRTSKQIFAPHVTKLHIFPVNCNKKNPTTHDSDSLSYCIARGLDIHAVDWRGRSSELHRRSEWKRDFLVLSWLESGFVLVHLPPVNLHTAQL